MADNEALDQVHRNAFRVCWSFAKLTFFAIFKGKTTVMALFALFRLWNIYMDDEYGKMAELEEWRATNHVPDTNFPLVYSLDELRVLNLSHEVANAGCQGLHLHVPSTEECVKANLPWIADVQLLQDRFILREWLSGYGLHKIMEPLMQANINSLKELFDISEKRLRDILKDQVISSSFAAKLVLVVFSRQKKDCGDFEKHYMDTLRHELTFWNKVITACQNKFLGFIGVVVYSTVMSSTMLPFMLFTSVHMFITTVKMQQNILEEHHRFRAHGISLLWKWDANQGPFWIMCCTLALSPMFLLFHCFIASLVRGFGHLLPGTVRIMFLGFEKQTQFTKTNKILGLLGLICYPWQSFWWNAFYIMAFMVCQQLLINVSCFGELHTSPLNEYKRLKQLRVVLKGDMFFPSNISEIALTLGQLVHASFVKNTQQPQQFALFANILTDIASGDRNRMQQGFHNMMVANKEANELSYELYYHIQSLNVVNTDLPKNVLRMLIRRSLVAESLESLDLENVFGFDDSVASSLAEVLKSNTSLKRLKGSFDDNCYKQWLLKIWAALVCENFGRIRLTSTGIVTILESVLNNSETELKEICVKGIQVGPVITNLAEKLRSKGIIVRIL